MPLFFLTFFSSSKPLASEPADETSTESGEMDKDDSQSLNNEVDEGLLFDNEESFLNESPIVGSDKIIGKTNNSPATPQPIMWKKRPDSSEGDNSNKTLPGTK